MKYKAIIFDLDETLMPETTSVRMAFEQACEPAVTKHGLDAVRLSEAVRHHGRDLWHTSPVYPWYLSIGISSWEGLCGDFGGDGRELAATRQWMSDSGFRTVAWINALAEFGVEDPRLAGHLAERLVVVRAKHHRLFPETENVLNALRGYYRLGLLTNGAPRIQRSKIEAVGLGKYFDMLVISAEVGFGKPDVAAFQLVLDRLGVAAGEAVMIGDSLARDIAGAKSARLQNIWINRMGKSIGENVQPDAEISDLRQLLDPTACLLEHQPRQT